MAVDTMRSAGEGRIRRQGIAGSLHSGSESLKHEGMGGARNFGSTLKYPDNENRRRF